ALAKKESITIHRPVRVFAMPADYVAEMARQVIYQRYREEAYTRGIKVYTTLRKSDQEAAYRALRNVVLAYDDRHGYRGVEASPGLPKKREDLENIMRGISDSDDILAALVLAVGTDSVAAYLKNGETIQLTGDGLKVARKFLTNEPKI